MPTKKAQGSSAVRSKRTAGEKSKGDSAFAWKLQADAIADLGRRVQEQGASVEMLKDRAAKNVQYTDRVFDYARQIERMRSLGMKSCNAGIESMRRKANDVIGSVLVLFLVTVALNYLVITLWITYR